MTQPDQAHSGDAARLASQVRETIDRGLVTPVFQPIVDLHTADIRAYEALTRTLPESAFPDPGSLFDAAEQTGLLWDLETVTRRASLAAAADWPTGVLLFLNCSPQVVADERFAETLVNEVAQIRGLSPRRVVLEVTERSENQHVNGLHRQTLALQEHGFQLAIDDVGAGTSGLNRIMLLRPQWLKLDRELVERIDRDPVRTNLVRFLTHFAKLSGVTIIGEGIEREAELEQLVRLGVHCGQGYLLGRPGAPSQSVPEQVVERIRAESRPNRPSTFAAERMDRLARMVRQVCVVHGDWSAGDVGRALEATPGVEGAVVTIDGVCAGWVPSESVTAALAVSPDALASELAVSASRSVRLGASIDEALEIAASAPGDEFVRPLVVTEAGRVVGTVEVRDLIRAAADACRDVEHRAAPLTGLPGRVRCEQKLDAVISAAKVVDAAFIDLRGLADYNAVFGFDLGDDMIRQLVAVVTQVVEARYGDSAEAFLGHLGDDRLLLLLPPGQTEEVAEQIVRLFQTRVQSAGMSPQAALAGLGASSATTGVAVRFLAVRDVGAAHDCARELFRAEPTLRALADEQAAMNPVSPGYLVMIDPAATAHRLRLAA